MYALTYTYDLYFIVDALKILAVVKIKLSIVPSAYFE